MTEPKQIGRYQIREELGRGGMAVVYLAHDPRFNRSVAVKVLPEQFTYEPMFRARFEREAQTIARLEHPAIVPVYDFGEAEGQPYLVMRQMLGGSLSGKLKNGPLSISQAAKILERVASGLEHAHALGIIHRDIKPANILFDQFNNAYLADFGIAKILEATTTLTGSDLTVGTPAYMSPEQVKGEKVDNRSDIYSLGVLLFEMLSGNQPYEATTPIAVAFKHVHEPIPDILSLNASLPLSIQATIDKAMSKKRKDRFSTAGKLAKSVATLAKQTPSLEPTRLIDSDDKFYASLAEVSTSQPKTAVNTSAVPYSPVSPVNSTSQKGKIAILTAVPLWIWSIVGLFILAGIFWGMFSLLSDQDDSFSTPIAETEVTQENPDLVVPDQVTETPTDSPTQTVTSVVAPTNTQTQVPTMEPTETAVLSIVELPIATICPLPQLRVTTVSVNVRSGPGTSYGVQQIAYANDTFIVIASTESGSWYNIELGADESGWISTAVGEIVVLEACDSSIPVAATIPPPPILTATPLPSPTQTPSPLPQAAQPPGGDSPSSSNPSPTPPPP